MQEVLAELTAGRKCNWFLPYTPTESGRAFLQALWHELFGSEHGRAQWFVSEYELPVPLEWRDQIPFTYRCPDFACGDDERVLIIELKTERGSYSAQQMVDYLRLARHRLPVPRIDVALLGPHLPGGDPPHDERQRYAEITWANLPRILQVAFPSDDLAERLSAFLVVDLAAPGVTPPKPVTRKAATPPAGGGGPAPTAAEQEEPPADESAAAVMHALRMAPALAMARSGDNTERGIDVAFESINAARGAQAQVKAALDTAGFTDRVGVWLWQPSSTGLPTTAAGRETGRELRLHPRSGTPT